MPAKKSAALRAKTLYSKKNPLAPKTAPKVMVKKVAPKGK